MVFTSSGNVDKLYLEALQTKAWQESFTTLGFEDWLEFQGVAKMLKYDVSEFSIPTKMAIYAKTRQQKSCCSSE